MSMMCHPEERDLRYAARQALAEARAAGLRDEALVEAAVDADAGFKDAAVGVSLTYRLAPS